MGNYLFKYLTIFISVFLFTGCPKSLDTIEKEKTIPPSIGSTFTFHDATLDSSGVELPDGFYTSIDSVAETGLTLYGKRNVTHIIFKNLKENSTANKYYNYEDNGNISLFLPAPISKWITFPIQQSSYVGVMLFDTTIDTVHRIAFDTITAYGYLMKEVTYTITTSSAVTQNDTAVINWDFNPRIGYFGSVQIVPYQQFWSIHINSNNLQRTLVSYSLK